MATSSFSRFRCRKLLNKPPADKPRGLGFVIMKEHMRSVREEAAGLLERLGVPGEAFAGGDLGWCAAPSREKPIGRVTVMDAAAHGRQIEESGRAFEHWRKVPPPRRGEFIRLFAEELRVQKETLGRLVTLEAGKILSEGAGEVQEMIDICSYMQPDYPGNCMA